MACSGLGGDQNGTNGTHHPFVPSPDLGAMEGVGVALELGRGGAWDLKESLEGPAKYIKGPRTVPPKAIVTTHLPLIVPLTLLRLLSILRDASWPLN
jgi:hypothetical protein